MIYLCVSMSLLIVVGLAYLVWVCVLCFCLFALSSACFAVEQMIHLVFDVLRDILHSLLAVQRLST